MKRYRCKIVLTTTLERVIEANCTEDLFDAIDSLETDRWIERDASWDVVAIIELKGGASC
ncbi:MAG: hypothetical protein KJ587_11880 [Alphaproteobacteria bacterium]|nr:hypothetical protein [Alphaproteobacteria bacterium]